ncbi:MAG: flagellar filament capping protein FliD [Spongiibacteraceae bacterium]|jgi:flagellar hook-associated protein 2|nr:flagellar filament capping protein FliD [Spongiibacteraceae bacterium]
MSFLDGTTDVRTFASQLVAAERAPADTLIRNQKSYFQNRLNAYNAIASRIESFQSKLADLKKFDQSFAATTSAEGYVEVSAGASAAPGVYAIHVEQLAAAHQLALDFGAAEWQAPAGGKLELTVGGQSFAVDFASLPADADLAALRDAINNAADNAGVSAALVRSGDNLKLLLTAKSTGAANAIAVTVSDGAPEDTQFTAMADIVAGATTLSAARDAVIRLGTTNPLVITAASNRLENVIDGLSLTLTRAHTDPADHLEITVVRDAEASRSRLQTLVDEYNSLVDLLGRHTSSANGNQPALAGDSTGRLLIQQLRAQFNELGGGLALSSVGISADRYGKLQIDGSRLDKFMTGNPGGLTDVIGGNDGLASRLEALLKPYVSGSNAVLRTRAASMQNGLDRLTDRQEQLDHRMDQVYKRYLAQFTQMQNLVLQMQQTFNMFI